MRSPIPKTLTQLLQHASLFINGRPQSPRLQRDLNRPPKAHSLRLRPRRNRHRLFVQVTPANPASPSGYALKFADFKGHWRISQKNTPAVGDTAHGHWMKDGIVWWVKGRVTDVHRDKTFYIVTGKDMATAETYWGRDVENGTKPALGFR
ncbi:hypothetical protein BJX66DRAFT_337213 [Aspergillus keveii]|uniref:Uncharacterized protein n=1 Tax=Aspergillus keveii TaxID=714993 RepID=A0ABR4G861_9EURO